MEKSLVVAIDGTGGSGKSTIAKALAKKLDILYIDTGAMYRALAYYFHKKKIGHEEVTRISEALKIIDMSYGVSDENLISINDENLTLKIREHEVSKLASIYSQIKSIRSFLVGYQRKLGKVKVCVMEGRDIGSVVFPDSFCKFFVSASPRVRAERRYDQLQEKGMDCPPIEKIEADLMKRDEADRNRDHSPLKQEEDALYVDTSDKSVDEILEDMVATVRQKAKENSISL